MQDGTGSGSNPRRSLTSDSSNLNRKLMKLWHLIRSGLYPVLWLFVAVVLVLILDGSSASADTVPISGGPVVSGSGSTPSTPASGPLSSGPSMQTSGPAATPSGIVSSSALSSGPTAPTSTGTPGRTSTATATATVTTSPPTTAVVTLDPQQWVQVEAGLALLVFFAAAAFVASFRHGRHR